MRTRRTTRGYTLMEALVSLLILSTAGIALTSQLDLLDRHAHRQADLENSVIETLNEIRTVPFGADTF